MKRYIPTIAALVFLAGCATPTAPAPRPEKAAYFTDEQMHRACDGDDGCVLMPGAAFKIILKQLQGQGA